MRQTITNLDIISLIGREPVVEQTEELFNMIDEAYDEILKHLS